MQTIYNRIGIVYMIEGNYHISTTNMRLSFHVFINLISLVTGRGSLLVVGQVVGARLSTSGNCIARLVHRQAFNNVSDSHGLSDGTLQTKVHGRESVEHRSVIEAAYWQ